MGIAVGSRRNGRTRASTKNGNQQMMKALIMIPSGRCGGGGGGGGGVLAEVLAEGVLAEDDPVRFALPAVMGRVQGVHCALAVYSNSMHTTLFNLLGFGRPSFLLMVQGLYCYRSLLQLAGYNGHYTFEPGVTGTFFRAIQQYINVIIKKL